MQRLLWWSLLWATLNISNWFKIEPFSPLLWDVIVKIIFWLSQELKKPVVGASRQTSWWMEKIILWSSFDDGAGINIVNRLYCYTRWHHTEIKLMFLSPFKLSLSIEKMVNIQSCLRSKTEHNSLKLCSAPNIHWNGGLLEMPENSGIDF